MHRIDGPGHVNNQFTPGNPNIGQQATMVTADWMNAVQEEIAHVIEQAGIVLDKESATQLYDAMVAMIAGVVGDGDGAVPTTREINVAGGLLTGGGDLVADRTITLTKATAEQVAAMLLDNVVVTPLALGGGVGGRLLAGVGYATTLGLLEVWGTYTVGANASVNITFPESFPTMCVHADCTGGRLDYSAQDNNPVVSGKSSSGCTIFNAGDVSVSGTYWARGF